MGLIDSKKLLAEAIARTKPKKADPVAQPPLEEASAPMYPEVSPEGPQQFPDTDPQAAIEQAASVGVQQALGGKDASAAQAVPPQPQDELQSLLAQVKDAQDRRDQLRSKHSELLGAYQIIGGRASSNLAPVKAGIYKDQEAAATGDIAEQQALVNQAKNQSLQQQKAESDLGLNKNLRDAQSPVSQGKLAFINDILKRSGYSELPPGVSAAEADSVIGALGIGSGIFRSEEAQQGVNKRFDISEKNKAAEAEAKRQAAIDLARTKAGLRRGGVDPKTARADAKDIETDTQRLAREIGEDPAGMSEKFKRINDALNNPAYKSDLPGVGPLDSRIPSVMQSPAGQQLKSDGLALANALLKLQSGAGVTENERRITYELYGVAPNSSEQAFRSGMPRLQADLAKQLKAKEAGFRPEVVENYRKRGGVTDVELSGAGGEASVKPGGDMVNVRRQKDGKVVPVPALDAARLVSAGGYEVVNE